MKEHHQVDGNQEAESQLSFSWKGGKEEGREGERERERERERDCEHVIVAECMQGSDQATHQRKHSWVSGTVSIHQFNLDN